MLLLPCSVSQRRLEAFGGMRRNDFYALKWSSGRTADERSFRLMRTLAYLDPGSGSMILQMLLGGIAAVAVSIKMFGKKIFKTLAFWKKDEPEKTAPVSSAKADSEKEAAKEPV
jgi:hypothetical protein